MKSSLTQGLDEDMAEEIRLNFNSSAVIRRRLTEVIKSKSRGADRDSLLKEGYECPSWAYKQADLVGYKRAMSEIIHLLTEKVS